ncbi:MAG: PKD domain-containing protein [Ilumatobacteraceae bacterium]
MRFGRVLGVATTVATLIGGVAWTAPGVSAAGPLGQLPTENPANFTPNVNNGEVDSIWQIGSRVVIGGTFTQVANSSSNGGATYTRNRIASFNASTGVVDTAFAPVFNGNVTTVIPAADGSSVYVAGNFTTVNGVSRSRVARVNLSNGSLVTSFNAGTISGNVRDMRLVGGQLYIGGAFTSVGGQSRQRLASLNPDTGAVTTKVNISFAGTQNGGTTQVFKMEATPAGDRLLVIGNFAQVGGQDRRQIAMIDLSTTPATVSGWQTNFYTSTCASAFDAYIRDLDIADDGSFAIVSTTGAYRANTSCDTIARFPVYTTQSGLQPTWIDYTGGDTSYAVQVRAGVVFVGGHQRWFNNPYAGDRAGPGAVPREGIAALDVVNGLPFSWNPGRDRGVGVFDFHVTDAGLWAGSDTDRWAGEQRRKLAFFPWSGGVTIPENLIASLPGEVWLLGRTSGTTTQQDEVRHRTYTGTGAPGATTTTAGTEQWRDVRASFMVNDTLYTLMSNGTFQRRTFNGSFPSPTAVNIYSNNIISDAPNISGMFFEPQDSRIYYTMSGNNSLFYRYFTPESHVIGATRFTASAGSLSPNRVRGMFLSGGNIWFADNNSGNLLRIGFASGAVTGSATTVDTTVDWRARAMFLDGDPVAPPTNEPPIANFTSSCNVLACTFTSTSTDTDGQIVSAVWNFGDGSPTSSSGSHTYAAGGTYNVTLTVTDDDGASTPITKPVVVSGPGNVAPVASFTSSCSQLVCSFTSTSTDSDGQVVSAVWNFGDGPGSSSSGAHTYAAPGTYDVTLTVTDDDGAVDDVVVPVTVSSVVSTVGFRAGASSNGSGSNASVVVPAAVQSGDQLLLFVTSNIETTASTPAGWTLLGTESDGSPDMRSWVFTRTADGSTGGSSVTSVLGTGAAKSSRMVVAYSGAGVPSVIVSSVRGPSSTSLASPSVAVGSNGSLVVSAWADKTSSGTGWSLPGSVASRATDVGSGGGRITAVVGDSAASAGTWPGATATSSVAGSKAIAWSIVVPPTGGGGGPGNVAPVASFTSSCSQLVCSFTSTSTDSDGQVVSAVWNFGDGPGSSSSGAHTYAAPGTYDVTLTVTDDDGAVDDVVVPVTVSSVVSTVGFRAGASSNGSGSNASVVVPAAVQSGDQLLLFVTSNIETTASTPAGWTLLGTESDGSPDMRSWVFTRTADGSTGGSSVTSVLGTGAAKSSRMVVAYSGAGVPSVIVSSVRGPSSTSLASPSVAVGSNGSLVVSAWADKTSSGTGWSLPGSVASRATDVGSGGGRITAVVGDSAASAGTWPGATATSSVAGSKAIAWSIVVAPA